MAVYEKTGYSHSETSLSAIIYQSAKVGIPSTGSIQQFITRLTKKMLKVTASSLNLKIMVDKY